MNCPSDPSHGPFSEWKSKNGTEHFGCKACAWISESRRNIQDLIERQKEHVLSESESPL
jgi:Zn-finger protein